MNAVPAQVSSPATHELTEANLAAPIGAPEFADLMTPLGPFEAAPHVAVAVSGGADSMALALLADRWAKDRSGRITALTVDHGLRPESAKEAHAVAGWLGARGITHETLQWHGPKPRTGKQAAARHARYALMEEWCRKHGLLHLLVAHHCQDQVETHLIRLQAGSGGDGLAGMAAISERNHLRLLRPLLNVDKNRLCATLRARSQDWIEDPSNNDPAYARSRLRAGPSPAGIEETTDRLGRQRAALEGETAALLARIAAVDAAGFCRFDREGLIAAEPGLARRALARMLVTVSGRIYAPRSERLDRLLHALIITDGPAGRPLGRTLAGCRIVPCRGEILVCREPAAARARIALTHAGAYRWDNRFTLQIGDLGDHRRETLEIARLGRDGWAQLTAADPGLRTARIPPPVRPSLPAVYAGNQVVAAPHLGFAAGNMPITPEIVPSVRFTPTLSLAGPVFGVV